MFRKLLFRETIIYADALFKSLSSFHLPVHICFTLARRGVCVCPLKVPRFEEISREANSPKNLFPSVLSYSSCGSLQSFQIFVGSVRGEKKERKKKREKLRWTFAEQESCFRGRYECGTKWNVFPWETSSRGSTALIQTQSFWIILTKQQLLNMNAAKESGNFSYNSSDEIRKLVYSWKMNDQ